MSSQGSPSQSQGDDTPPVIEWFGGPIETPAILSHDNAPSESLTLIWAKISEGARGTTPVRPDELIAKARSSLQSAIENPIIGQPERPTRVRVPTEELAEELRADDRRQRAVEIEIVPLENRACRRGDDDLALLAGVAGLVEGVDVRQHVERDRVRVHARIRLVVRQVATRLVKLLVNSTAWACFCFR